MGRGFSLRWGRIVLLAVLMTMASVAVGALANAQGWFWI